MVREEIFILSQLVWPWDKVYEEVREKSSSWALDIENQTACHYLMLIRGASYVTCHFFRRRRTKIEHNIRAKKHRQRINFSTNFCLHFSLQYNLFTHSPEHNSCADGREKKDAIIWNALENVPILKYVIINAITFSFSPHRGFVLHSIVHTFLPQIFHHKATKYYFVSNIEISIVCPPSIEK